MGEFGEIGVYADHAIVEVRAGEDAVKVHMLFEGCWMVGIGPALEGRPIPEWPMEWKTHENGYSACLVMHAPDDATVHQIHPEPASDE